MCILCVRVKINKRSFEPFCVWILGKDSNLCHSAGEDRWLCTLILQQGKRVEYAAAADALTFCPDDFGEFYKQRRRWTPSTMANILDLLSDWRHVTRVNGSISLLFITYQVSQCATFFIVFLFGQKGRDLCSVSFEFFRLEKERELELELENFIFQDCSLGSFRPV